MITEASGYLIPNLIGIDQNRILWGLFGGKKVPPRFHDDKKLTECFFGRIFPPVDKAIENAFARDLGGIVQRYVPFRLWAMTNKSQTIVQRVNPAVSRQHATICGL